MNDDYYEDCISQLNTEAIRIIGTIRNITEHNILKIPESLSSLISVSSFRDRLDGR